MKRTKHSMFKYGHGRCKKGSNADDDNNNDNKNKNKRRRSFYELFSVIWPLVFLFYFGVCLSDGNGDYIPPTNNSTLSNNINNKSRTTEGAANEPAPIGVSDDMDTAPIELNISINVTTAEGYNTLSSSCLLPRQSRVEDLAFYILGYTALVCQAPVIVVGHRRRRLEDQHHERTTLDGYLDLDEFRNITRQGKKPGESKQRINVTHRLELDGSKYNYASMAKGAKVVAHNKEAKGAGNILGKDHDQYLINPCSVGGKFVVVELAEETLVDAVMIANFEHHSSNFKEFELYGSLNYPTDVWSVLGKFMALNVKQAQTFTLPEPKWVRYLNLSLISHYGSEHYCTLSVLEVYGVDAIERMLEDLMVAADEPGYDQVSKHNITTTAPSNLEDQKSGEAKNNTESRDKGTEKTDDGKPVKVVTSQTVVDPGKSPDSAHEVRQKPSNRMPGDAVLKLLMQKVRSLELNLSVFEGYLRELSRRQGGLMPQLDKEISRISLHVEKERKEMKELLEWKDSAAKEIKDMEIWKAVVSSQMEALIDESRKLKYEVRNVAQNQATLATREFAVLAVNFAFMGVALYMVISRRFSLHDTNEAARTTKGWMVILVSSCLTMLIGLLSV